VLEPQAYQAVHDTNVPAARLIDVDAPQELPELRQRDELEVLLGSRSGVLSRVLLFDAALACTHRPRGLRTAQG
jgi:hypothetical protein